MIEEIVKRDGSIEPFSPRKLNGWGEWASKALGQDVLKSLTPGQQVIKIVRDEMTELLGGTLSKINFTPNPPTIIMLVGLQGSRKNNNSRKAC